MTPFPVDRMEAVLSRVSSVGHGFPIMLRHRLQVGWVRGMRGGGGAGWGAVGGGYGFPIMLPHRLQVGWARGMRGGGGAG